MKAKTVFICQVTDTAFKALKVVPAEKFKILGCELCAVSSGADDRKISETISDAFKKLGYKRNPVIVSLPRNNVICRYIKIPAVAPEEIEKIISLQAPRYLPYPANLLITGYQIISRDKEGNSYLNLIIAHKDIIERILRLFKDIAAKNISILLSSYGISNLYRCLRPQDLSPVMIIDLDYNQAELAVISKSKLLFSRFFKFDITKEGWETLLIDEIKKTHEAYLKEATDEIPGKVIITGASKALNKFTDALKGNLTLPVEIVLYTEKIRIPENLSDCILNSDYSLASLVGLGFKPQENSLSLITKDIKEARKTTTLRSEQIRAGTFILLTLCAITISTARNLYNKRVYLKQINQQLEKISGEVKPTEALERRISALENRMTAKSSALSLLHELYNVMPDEISLVNFTYEEDKLLTLRGIAPELNSVVIFNSGLEKSPLFKDYAVGIKFTSTRKTQTVEIVDFEIACFVKK